MLYLIVHDCRFGHNLDEVLKQMPNVNIMVSSAPDRSPQTNGDWWNLMVELGLADDYKRAKELDQNARIDIHKLDETAQDAIDMHCERMERKQAHLDHILTECYKHKHGID